MIREVTTWGRVQRVVEVIRLRLEVVTDLGIGCSLNAEAAKQATRDASSVATCEVAVSMSAARIPVIR